MRRLVWVLVVVVAAAGLAAACGMPGTYLGQAPPKTYEVWIPDQGYDKVIIYSVREDNGAVTLTKSGEVALAPPGPQPTVAPHIILFGPGYKRAFVAGVARSWAQYQ